MIFPPRLRSTSLRAKSLLPQIELLPTGGVSLRTAADFIAAGAFALGLGADLVDLAALRRGESATITEKARQYSSAVSDENISWL